MQLTLDGFERREKKVHNEAFVHYMGGKSYIADKIVSIFPEHEVYVEVFGGGASVLFEKTRSKIEVYNDIWDDIVNLFLVLRDKTEELKKWLKYTPYSRKYHKIALEKFRKREFKDDVERAGILFYLLRSSRSGQIGNTFAVGIKRNNATYYKNVVDRLEEFAERFRGVIIENLDFEECIKKYDSEKTLFYCDPPYIGVYRDNYYVKNFTLNDHYRLARVLKGIKGKFVLSYYPHPVVEKLYPREEFHWIEIEMPKFSKVVVDEERPKGVELLITNYKPNQWWL